jgi:hypothetical protein
VATSAQAETAPNWGRNQRRGVGKVGAPFGNHNRAAVGFAKTRSPELTALLQKVAALKRRIREAIARANLLLAEMKTEEPPPKTVLVYDIIRDSVPVRRIVVEYARGSKGPKVTRSRPPHPRKDEPQPGDQQHHATHGRDGKDVGLLLVHLDGAGFQHRLGVGVAHLTENQRTGAQDGQQHAHEHQAAHSHLRLFRSPRNAPPRVPVPAGRARCAGRRYPKSMTYCVGLPGGTLAKNVGEAPAAGTFVSGSNKRGKSCFLAAQTALPRQE